MKQKNVNMLSGPLLKNMTVFALPVMLTEALGVLFHSTDLIVVGQFCGFKIIWLFTVFRIPACHTYLSLMWSFVVSWILDAILNSIILFKDWKRLETESGKSKRDSEREAARTV